MPAGWVYVMSNRRNGILYAGVTSNLPQRAFQHREGQVAGFTKRYGLKILVYYEPFDDIRNAIGRARGRYGLCREQIPNGGICPTR